MNVKKNDTVVVLTGKYNKKQGKVLATSPKNNTVVVEGVNLQKQHEKAIKTVEGPIDASNVMVVCDACGKATRVKHAFVDGKKVRVCAKCGAALDKAYVKAVKADAKAEEEAPKKRTRKRTAKAAEAETETKSEE